MPTVFVANESAVLVNGEAVEGVRAVEYRRATVRSDLYAIGAAERIGVVSGHHSVEGRLRVASASRALDALGGDDVFQISAQLRHGETTLTVSFDECLLTEKSFAMGAGGHGEAVYAFTATRVRESE
ncbi:MAG: hypothetical protein MUF35_00805 [Candidatus Nanopelagicales bacterium]|jgi:hypothetical protein|nr:hypothetical protein [Candidatus Nanopelagicales bacterium]